MTRRVLALLAALGGCTAVDGYRLEAGGGFLVVARHERHLSAITETAREVTGYEVLSTAPDGAFWLRRSKGWLAQPASYLVISRPGFQLFAGWADPPRNSGGFPLQRAASFREELLATWRFERETGELLEGLDPEQRRAVEAHGAARRAHLARSYPAELAAYERRLRRRRFVERPGLGRGVVAQAAVALADGGVAVVSAGEDGRVLLVYDGAQRLAGRAALSDRGRGAALARDGDAIAVFDGGAIKRFDRSARPLPPIALAPAPGPGDPVQSLALVPAGVVLGLDRAQAAARVRLHDRQGKLVRERELPGLRSLERAFLAPNGAVIVLGEISQLHECVTVAGLEKCEQPRGLVRLEGGSAEPAVVAKGIFDAVASESGLVAYAVELHAREDQDLAGHGVPGFRQQRLLRMGWDGRVTQVHDVSDEAMSWALRMGEPLGERVPFLFGEDRIAELDLGRLDVLLPEGEGAVPRQRGGLR